MKQLIIALCLVASFAQAQVSQRYAARIYRVGDQLVISDSVGTNQTAYPFTLAQIVATNSLVRVNISGLSKYYVPAKILNSSGVAYSTTSTTAAVAGILATVPNGTVPSSVTQIGGVRQTDFDDNKTATDALLGTKLTYLSTGVFTAATAPQIQYDNSTWIRKSGSITPDGGVTLAGPTGFYYQRKLNGVVKFEFYNPNPDGVTGNADLLEKALAVGLPVEIPNDGGKYCIERTVTTPLITRIIGSGTLTSVAGAYAMFSPPATSSFYMENVKLELPALYTGDVVTAPGSTNPSESNIVLRKVSGVTAGTGKLLYVGVRRTGTVIEDCSFEGGSGLCLLWGTQRSSIQRNRYKGPGRAIQLYGGSYNMISGNVIDGLGTAITGITIFSWRSNNLAQNLMRGNVITGNTVYRVTEEGISMDMIGNSADRMPEHPTHPMVTVASASYANLNQINITLSDVSGEVNAWAFEYYAVILTGNAAGHICRINAAGANNIYLDSWTGIKYTDLAAGDKILITTGFLQNVITNNTVREVGTHGISLYGAAWGNRVANNTVMDATWRGISIVSVLGGGLNAKGYSGMNTIESNTLAIRDDPMDRFDTIAAPHAAIMIESREYSGGDALISPRTIGNIIRNNTLLTAQPIYLRNVWDNTVEGNQGPNNSLGIIVENSTRAKLLKNVTVSRGPMNITQIGTNTDFVTGESLAQITFSSSLTYNAIVAGGFQTQFITIAGLKLGDVAIVNPTTLPTGIGFAGFITDNSGVKVAVRMFNYTAASITPGTLTINGVVNRKLPTQ